MRHNGVRTLPRWDEMSAEHPEQLRLSPLLPSDPPKVAGYWLDSRLVAAPAGVAYVAHDALNTPTLLILLSEGAANDAGARDRFAGVINQLHIDTVLARGGRGQDDGRLGRRFSDDASAPDIEDPLPATPWAALAYDASPASLAEARRVLAAVDLSSLPPSTGAPGPDYQLHWRDAERPGLAKLWPLPWPGRHDRAGWLSILASWLLMMLLAALAVLIAILIFQQAPQTSPPPPVPTTASPTSGSPSPASPSPGSASPTPSPGTTSPTPGTASPSGAGSPTPNSRL